MEQDLWRPDCWERLYWHENQIGWQRLAVYQSKLVFWYFVFMQLLMQFIPKVFFCQNSSHRVWSRSMPRHFVSRRAGAAAVRWSGWVWQTSECDDCTRSCMTSSQQGNEWEHFPKKLGRLNFLRSGQRNPKHRPIPITYRDENTFLISY